MKSSKHIASLFTVLGLGLLLLLSPCKVRHFIQAELGVEQTQVLNKSQSFVPQLRCSVQELTQTDALTVKLDDTQLNYAGVIPFIADGNPVLLQASIQKDDLRLHLGLSIPLYILYKHLKLHL